MGSLELNFDTTSDDNFFGRLPNSSLEELFRVQPPLAGQSLKYKPVSSSTNLTLPTKTLTAPPENSELKFVKIAHVFKDHTAIGKAGVAMYGSEPNMWRIMIYKKREKILAEVTSTARRIMSFFQLRGGYMQFYDDNNNYWSIMFESSCDEEEFCQVLQSFGIEIRQPNDVTDAAKDCKKVLESERLAEVENILLEMPTSSVTQFDSDGSGEALACEKKIDIISEPIKNDVIARLAKVGKKLPSVAGNQQPSQLSDSDAEVISSDNLSEKPLVKPRIACNQAPLTTVGHCMEVLNHMETQYMRMMINESRCQNSEIHMELQKLYQKTEEINVKLGMLKGEDPGEKFKREDEIIRLEEKVLQLKKENRELKLQAKKTHISEVKSDYSDLCERINDNHGDVLKTIHVEVKVEPEVKNLEDFISNLVCKSKELQAIIDQQKSECFQAIKQMQKSDLALKTAEENHNSTEAKMKMLEDKIKSLESIIKLKDEEIEGYQKQQKSQEEQHGKQLNAQSEQMQLALKEVMNNLMNQLRAELPTMSNINAERVIVLCGNAIRDHTFKALASWKK